MSIRAIKSFFILITVFILFSGEVPAQTLARTIDYGYFNSYLRVKEKHQWLVHGDFRNDKGLTGLFRLQVYLSTVPHYDKKNTVFYREAYYRTTADERHMAKILVPISRHHILYRGTMHVMIRVRFQGAGGVDQITEYHNIGSIDTR